MRFPNSDMNLCPFLVHSEVYLVRIKGTFLYTSIHHFLCSKDKIKEILLKENRNVIRHPASHDCAFLCNSLMWYQTFLKSALK